MSMKIYKIQVFFGLLFFGFFCQAKLLAGDNHWKVYKNTANDFQFEMLDCFVVGEEHEVPVEQYVDFSFVSSPACKTDFKDTSNIYINVPGFKGHFDFETSLKSKDGLLNRKFRAGNKNILLKVRRYNAAGFDGVDWSALIPCNNFDLNIGMLENVDAKGIEQIKAGKRNPPDFFQHIIRSVKCTGKKAAH